MLEEYFLRSRVRARIRANILGGCLEEMGDYLNSRGHPIGTVQLYLQAGEHFGRWLMRKKIRLASVNEDTIDIFLQKHLPVCRCSLPSPTYLATVRAALHYLFPILQKHQPLIRQSCPKPSTIEAAVLAFNEHLTNVCGLSSATCHYRCRYVREFLVFKFGKSAVRLKSINAGDLVSFILSRSRECKPGSAQVIASSLRCYLRFLELAGFRQGHLIAAVPRIRQWALASLPKTMNEEHLRKFLAAFDRTTVSGLRDYAMALCMLVLGLRVSEVALLNLEDVNWHEATLRVPACKKRRARTLPLTHRVGQAIAAYLRQGRPLTKERRIFVRHTVPLGSAIAPSLIREAVRRAYARAGLPVQWTGTHILRHTAATRLHQHGASLKEVADILGHQCIESTSIYTKVDLSLLTKVAMPWPEVRS